MSKLAQMKTPIFYAEGMPDQIDRQNYTLIVDGLIEYSPRNFKFKEIEEMPFSEINTRLTSVSGWSVRALWQGVKFRDFVAFFRLQSKAAYAVFESFLGYTTCISIEDLMSENVLLCYKVDGEYLEPEYGAPLRLVVPHLWGYKSIKGLSKMTFTEYPELGYWETRGYPDDAQIEPGYVLDVNSGEKRKIKGGEVTEF